MNAALARTAAVVMHHATTHWAPSAVNATLGTVEMDPSVWVTQHQLNLCCCKNVDYFTRITCARFLWVISYNSPLALMLVILFGQGGNVPVRSLCWISPHRGWMSKTFVYWWSLPSKVMILFVFRHWWMFPQHKQLPCEQFVLQYAWLVHLLLRVRIHRKWSQLLR